jgi:hypothetical protein
MASTIDSGTKIQLGILVTLLGGLFGAAWWAASMTAAVSTVRDNSDRMTASMLRLEGMVSGHERKFAVSEEVDKAVMRRLDVLESKVLK